MWVVVFDRHELNKYGASCTYESSSYWKARLIYEWWTFFYLMSAFPVKQVSLSRIENGVIFIKGKLGKSQNVERLREIKCKRYLF